METKNEAGTCRGQGAGHAPKPDHETRIEALETAVAALSDGR